MVVEVEGGGSCFGTKNPLKGENPFEERVWGS